MRLAILAWFLLLSSGLAPASAQADPGPVWTELQKLRRDFYSPPSDQFAVEPSSDGTPFIVNGTVVDGTSQLNGTAQYIYRAGTLTITIALTPVQTPGIGNGYSDIIKLAERRNWTGAKRGMNGYGAQTYFRTLHVDNDGLLPVNVSELRDMSFTTQADPENARAIALGAHIQISGIISKLPSGKIGTCSVAILDATVANPRELMMVGCYVAAKITRMELTSQGRTLRAWTLAP